MDKYEIIIFWSVTIRCLRAEADHHQHKADLPTTCYNPLPPCGGRHYKAIIFTCLFGYNPLPPCGGRQGLGPPCFAQRCYNPLPPCGGRHLGRVAGVVFHSYNPLPPCGGRHTTL